MKYRKKPIAVEAFKYTGDLKDSEGNYCVPKWAEEAYKRQQMGYFPTGTKTRPARLSIDDSSEDGVIVAIGDYIIKGIHGELYPCKPDIFEESYAEVEDNEEKKTDLLEKRTKHLLKLIFHSGHERDYYIVELNTPEDVTSKMVHAEIDKINLYIHKIDWKDESGYFESGFNEDTLMNELCSQHKNWSWININDNLREVHVTE